MPIPRVLSSLLSVLIPLATLPAQRSESVPPIDPSPQFEAVRHGPPGTEHHWASGPDWKASFGTDGFTFVPCFGATAPHNFPVGFRLAAVRVGGRTLPFAEHAAPRCTGDRIEFARGAVQEIYDLSLAGVEQRFVVDTSWPGAVELELAVHTDLVEDPNTPGLQFRNHLGAVGYGSAFVLGAGERRPIETVWRDGRIVMSVPAALRGPGPLVIDPLINTQLTTSGSIDQHRYPEVAYDATHEAWLVVWESLFSATDTDVYGQMFDHDGFRIPGSGSTFDNSSLDVRRPRLANRNDIDQFLVVMERTDPAVANGRTMIYGMLRPAAPSGTVGAAQLISNPSQSGGCSSPDVGGDPAPGGGSNWPVIWAQSASGGTMWLRYVQASGTAIGNPTQLLTTVHPVTHLRISKSNGRGTVPNPLWMVVFDVGTPRPDHDVAAIAIDPVNGPGSPRSVVSSFDDDRNPEVTPVVLVPGQAPFFVITHERQNPASARAVIYRANQTGPDSAHDLTPHGIGPFVVRVQTDGLRYAFTSSQNASTISLSTLRFDRTTSTWSVHDGPRPLPGAPSFPSLISAHSSGGGLTDYAVAYVQGNMAPGRAALTRYNGHGDGVQLTFAATACNGLQLGWVNLPLLGNTMRFPLGNLGTDLPVLAFGAPDPAPAPLCANCLLGLRLDQPIQLFPGQTELVVPIPPLPELVGRTFAVQGFGLGNWPCVAGIRGSDTWWFTVR